ncbi:MAG TPA: glutamine synthetase type III, partial [Polyangia bacterium]|nr:glutamine synthetase type III [Polyangia bacterium]
VTELIAKLQAGLAGLEKAHGHHGADSLLAEAKHYCTAVLPAMLKVREAVDALEGVVDDALWPLPTFQELLFIK